MGRMCSFSYRIKSLSLLLALLVQPAIAQDEEAEEVIIPRVFITAERCAMCHDASPNAEALRLDDGTDVSPHGLWEATVMASSFIDPYWRAQLARELSLAPEESRAELEVACVKCHAPMAHHERRLMDRPLPGYTELLEDDQAIDGVSCTVCHRTGAEGLGDESSFNGNLPTSMEARMFGPYPEPFTGPMLMNTGYEPTFGPHMVQSSLCGSCHTLETHHAPGADPFLEQSSYLEWRNSEFSYEETGVTENTRSCQACHMPDVGSMRIAHNPMGGDFGFLEDRPEVRTHRFVGGNALLLDILGDNREELGARAPKKSYELMAAATRDQLAGRSAQLEMLESKLEGGRLQFSLRVSNLTGHKLPTGYPSRRMWLEVDVEANGESWFSSGVPDERGRIVPQAQALRLPHEQRITSGAQVQVWERIALNAEGVPTTRVATMATSLKDNRLLPRGWKADGPHAERTGSKGTDGDQDFVAGSDLVHFDLELPQGAGEEHTVRARLLYQTMPPAWVDPMRMGKTEEEARFVRMYDAAETPYEVMGELRKRIRVPR
ncbi:MAG: hypothetical protein ACI8QC_001324 [Planctomycetota bacterium]|jgi:hypothetical protein